MTKIELLKRLYKSYTRKYIKNIFIAVFFTILLAGSTSGVAYLLDPAIKQLFIEQEQSLIYIIPGLIVLAFIVKGSSLYIARVIMINVSEEVRKDIQTDMFANIIRADTQLIDKKQFNKHFEILLENLNILPSGKFKQISKLCKVSEEKLFQMIKILKTLNPKPAEHFNQENTHVDQPDIIVKRSAKGWRIDLNGSTLPSVNIDESYIQEMNNYNLDEKGNAFALEKIGEARWLKKAVDQRNKTILKVTSEILKKQIGFFRHGFSHMKPMILKDISDKIGMHESTVSRVTNSKLILTEWGVMPLKNFFSASISGSENSELHAASAVRETIKNLISSEISGKPLSDDKLAGILNKEGMDVARRTVAKYRDMLNIPSSSQRRKQARLMKFASN